MIGPLTSQKQRGSGETLALTLVKVEVAPALSYDPICQMVKDLPDSCGGNAMRFLIGMI
jgi:hypothetical protein